MTDLKAIYLQVKSDYYLHLTNIKASMLARPTGVDTVQVITGIPIQSCSTLPDIVLDVESEITLKHRLTSA